MSSTREVRNFGDDDNDQINLEDIASISFNRKSTTHERRIVEETAESSHFTSREPVKKKIKKRSPYIIQKNIKMRLGMSELLAEITKKVNLSSDQETLEIALGALIEREKLEGVEKKYKKLISDS